MGKAQNNGVGWHCTDLRRVEVLEMLKKQWTVGALAGYYGINVKTFSKAIKKAGIDWRAVRLSGIGMVRSRLYDDITMIDEPKDRAVVALRYLERYDREEEVEVEESDTSNVDSITLRIMAELEMKGGS